MEARLLVVAVLALEAAFWLAVALVLGHGAWLWAYRRWAHPRMADAREALRELTGEGTSREPALERLRRLPRTLRARAFMELGRVLTGTARERLRRAAQEVGLVSHAERLVRRRGWRTRLHGARILTRLGGSANAMLPVFRDPSAALRMQAAEWAALEGGQAPVRALVQLLGDGDRLCRATVQDSLVRLGGRAVPALEEFMSTAGGVALVGALEVAAAIPHEDFTGQALRRSTDADPQVRSLAVEVLAALGGDAASRTAVERLDDPDPMVRSAAAGAIGRLGWWAAAPRVAPLLRDPAWAVRRSAGLSLWALGSPGLLQLRRLRDDDDRFAADMAQQVLDLARVAEGEGT